MPKTKETKVFFFRTIKHAFKAVILSILIFTACGGMNLAIVNQATAGTWWDTAQQGGLNQVGQAYTTGEPRDARVIVVDIIRFVLGLLGIIAVVLILYAGFKWMLSRGNEEEISDAKKILIGGVIGLAIILSAYIIANFVINHIYSAATGSPVLFD